MRSIASIGASLFFAISAGSAAMAAMHFSTHREMAAKYIPQQDIPKKMLIGDSRSSELLTRYPDDPRAYIIRALWFLRQNNSGTAEGLLLQSKEVAARDAHMRHISPLADMILARLMLWQRRHEAAWEYAKAPCRQKQNRAMRKAMQKLKLCDAAPPQPSAATWNGWRASQESRSYRYRQNRYRQD